MEDHQLLRRQHHLDLGHRRPAASTIAIGDMTLDPNDHNTVYAGTGDLRYGSFSFGSNGVLESRSTAATPGRSRAPMCSTPSTRPTSTCRRSTRRSARWWSIPNDIEHRHRRRQDRRLSSPTTRGDTWTGPCLTNSFTDPAPGHHRPDRHGPRRDHASVASVGTRGFATTVQVGPGSERRQWRLSRPPCRPAAARPVGRR